jgi:hypothetical protein
MAYWEAKSLTEMTREEWEGLCDGCGLCCLIRFEDEDTGEVFATKVHCRLFDAERCACTDYANRREQVPDCIKLTPWNIEALAWMPKSCGYRRVHEGRPLADWHPLISGDPESVHAAGVSVRGQTVCETTLEDPEDAVALAAPEWDVERG